MASKRVYRMVREFQHVYVLVHNVRMEKRYNNCLFDKRQYDSNLLLFTPLPTV